MANDLNSQELLNIVNTLQITLDEDKDYFGSDPDASQACIHYVLYDFIINYLELKASQNG